MSLHRRPQPAGVLRARRSSAPSRASRSRSSRHTGRRARPRRPRPRTSRSAIAHSAAAVSSSNWVTWSSPASVWLTRSAAHAARATAAANALLSRSRSPTCTRSRVGHQVGRGVGRRCAARGAPGSPRSSAWSRSSRSSRRRGSSQSAAPASPARSSCAASGPARSASRTAPASAGDARPGRGPHLESAYASACLPSACLRR